MAVLSIKNGVVSRSMLVGNDPFTPSSFESIQTVTGDGSSSSLLFSSIAADWTHLQIRAIARDTNAGTSTGNYLMRFNGDTASNYTRHFLRGIGSGTVQAGGAANYNYINLQACVPFSGYAANVYGAALVDVLDYASGSKNKTVRGMTGIDDNGVTGNGQIALASGVWLSTSAITSITIISDGTAFTTGSTFALYGVK